MLTYISTNNLARYDGKIQEYAEGLCAPHGDACWRMTEKAQSVTFWPAGDSPMEGTVEFSFTETPPESGTKGPDNPSAIEGMDAISLAVYGEDGVNEAEYSIDLDGTYYGGSVDLATGLMTVTVAQTVLTSLASLTSVGTNTVLFGDQIPPHPNGFGGYICSCQELPLLGVLNVDVEGFNPWGGNGTTGVRIRLLKSWLDVSGATDPSNPTDAEWLVAGNAWVAAHPIHIVSQLWSPTTVQLTAPALRSLVQPDKYVPRPNTVYTDADAVQIVYQKSPIRDEFEKVQAIIAQGGNV